MTPYSSVPNCGRNILTQSQRHSTIMIIIPWRQKQQIPPESLYQITQLYILDHNVDSAARTLNVVLQFWLTLIALTKFCACVFGRVSFAILYRSVFIRWVYDVAFFPRCQHKWCSRSVYKLSLAHLLPVYYFAPPHPSFLCSDFRTNKNISTNSYLIFAYNGRSARRLIGHWVTWITLPRQKYVCSSRGNIGCVVFYVVRFGSKESRRLFRSTLACFLFMFLYGEWFSFWHTSHLESELAYKQIQHLLLPS
jgi:hypothetical protein